MALFFFVIGMEVSREFTLGELRDRRMVAVPLLAAVGGLVVPALIYLAFNAGGPGGAGWGIPIATDTAFVLGMMVLAGPRCPVPLRVFLLTLAVVDDVGAIGVIAIAYTREIDVVALGLAVALFVLVLVLRRVGVLRAPVYTALAIAIWVATVKSGLHPTVVGLALGVMVQVYNPRSEHVLEARELVHEFSREPTAERGYAVKRGLQAAVAPNERLQLLLHPWTSYLVVPLFALANAGIPLDPDTLARAATSPVTIGIVVALVVGKLVGVTAGSWVGLRSGLGLLPGNLVWGQLVGGAALAGIGFTVSLFITELAFSSEALRVEAKVGILAGSLLAAVLGRSVFWLAWDRGAVCAPPRRPHETDEVLPELLAEPVSDRDHVRGNPDAPVTVVEYGDYECPYCGRVYPVVERLLEQYPGEVRFVFRHYPLDSVHPRARDAALAAEAAGEHGGFWAMHDRLFAHQLRLGPEDLAWHAEQIGLSASVAHERRTRTHVSRVRADEASGEASGVRGTPTFFVNDRRHRGRLDFESLAAAVESSRDG